MAQILPETEATVFEDRTYVNPNTTVDETNAFIDNYRNLQQTNTNKIISDTHNLGTDVTSNLGGLSGSGSYWKNRYQTPQTSSAVADLRATAQAAALNTALENEKNAWTKRYNDAYRNYQKRSWNNSNNPTNNPDTGGDNKLDVDVNPDNESGGDTNENNTTNGPGFVSSVEGGLNVFTDYNGDKWTLRNLEDGDELLLGGLTSVGGNLKDTFPDGTPLTNGATYYAGGRMFMYVQNSQYPNGTFFRVGDSPTMSYR